MKNPAFIFCFAAVFGPIVSCTGSYDPLKDYEQLEPAKVLETPQPTKDARFDPEETARGQYLVSLLGCGSCHTDGALVGLPDNRKLLAGSGTGIAYSNPLADPNPGVVYPSNLTPDIETGIGSWTREQIANMVRTGVDNHGGRSIPVMPWPTYAKITQEDALAIAAYLKSLPPVKHQVPDNVPHGQRAQAPFVHFGVYRNRP